MLRLLLAALAAFFAFGVAGAPATPANVHIAVLLVNFSDDVRQPWTTDFISSEYNCCNATSGFGVADFYARASWNQLSVSADVYGWYVLPVSYAQDGCSLGRVSQQGNAAASAAGVDLSAYTNIVYLWPSHTGCAAGTGELSGNRSWVTVDPASCPAANGRCQSFHVFVHELGHNLGLNHAGHLSCVGGFFTNDCMGDEYGDTFDTMGCCTPSLFSNYHRLQLGFIPASQLRTIAQSGDYAIDDATDPASLVYRVADSRGQFLYFENRSLYTKYEGLEGYLDPGNLLVRRAPDYADPSNPTTGSLGRLDLGQRFSLPNAPVTISNIGWDGSSVTIHVQFPAPPLAQCADGIDNDADNKIDYPADKQCRNAADDDEKRR